jgi:hypothetical protein
MDVNEAIRAAEKALPGRPAKGQDEDPRWQAIIAVEEFVESDPDAVWSFVERWGTCPDEDLRAAIATCLLEHLLEYHFSGLFPKVEAAVNRSREFADTFSRCGQFGQSELPKNKARFEALQKRCNRAS